MSRTKAAIHEYHKYSGNSDSYIIGCPPKGWLIPEVKKDKNEIKVELIECPVCAGEDINCDWCCENGFVPNPRSACHRIHPNRL